MSHERKTVEVEATVIQEGAKAVQFLVENPKGSTKVWIPWSQIEHIDYDQDVVTITEWIAREKGLI